MGCVHCGVWRTEGHLEGHWARDGHQMPTWNVPGIDHLTALSSVYSPGVGWKFSDLSGPRFFGLSVFFAA